MNATSVYKMKYQGPNYVGRQRRAESCSFITQLLCRRKRGIPKPNIKSPIPPVSVSAMILPPTGAQNVGTSERSSDI
jgi:hypothetical protein